MNKVGQEKSRGLYWFFYLNNEENSDSSPKLNQSWKHTSKPSKVRQQKRGEETISPSQEKTAPSCCDADSCWSVAIIVSSGTFISIILLAISVSNCPDNGDNINDDGSVDDTYVGCTVEDGDKILPYCISGTAGTLLLYLGYHWRQWDKKKKEEAFAMHTDEKREFRTRVINGIDYTSLIR